MNKYQQYQNNPDWEFIPYSTGGSAPILAEAGEVYMTPDQEIKKIPDSADTHEDASGGVPIHDADRVLEDTSTYRNDSDSQALKLFPEQASALTGVKFNKPVSHSQALEDAKKHYGKFVFKINKNIEKNLKTLDDNKLDKYATNSLNLNMAHLQQIPTDGKLFDNLFQHQELLKQLAGIDQTQAAMCGGKYFYGGTRKAQVGVDNIPVGENIYSNTNGWRKIAENEQFTQYINNKTGKTVTTPKSNMTDAQWVDFKKNETPQHKAQRLGNTATNYGFQVKPIEGINSTNGINYTVNSRTSPNIPDTPVNTTGDQPVSRFNFRKQPISDFNEKLNWYDVAGPLGEYMSASDRIPTQFNPVQLNQIRLQLQNPEPALQAGQEDYNAALRTLPNTGQGVSNLSRLFTSKYNIDNQITGQYENINKGIKNQETEYNANVRDRQSVADQQARDSFEQKFLGSLEAQRQQKLDALNELYSRFAQNKALNRNANLIMKLAPAFDENGNFNGYKRYMFNPGQNTLGLPQQTKKKTS